MYRKNKTKAWALMTWHKYPEEKPTLKMDQWRKPVIVYGGVTFEGKVHGMRSREAWYTRDDVFECSSNGNGLKVTHWMPMPEPPEGIE